MNNIELPPEQQKAVADLVAQGWAREAAVLMVLESVEDVVDPESADMEDKE
ncbi:hypothetical protein [Horticoccus sp. 23ND18S-11]|uniref:hypothetical protein n=1 Tax=Horticoccus sp. 23ND18S-11 TaxID=3391832 RepID=UPI0039C96302